METQVKNGATVLEGSIAGGAPLAKTEGAEGQPKPQAQKEAPQRRPVPLVPQSMDDVFRMADALLGGSLLPERWVVQGQSATTRANLIMAIAMGVEIGMSPLQSLRELYVVKGQVRESTLSKLARVQSSGVCERFAVIESTATRCVVEVKRLGQPIRRHTYTIEDAEVAGLVNRKTKSDKPGNWEMRPTLMLRRRAINEVLDEEFADVVKGMLGAEDMAEEDLAESRRREPEVVAPTLRRVEEAEAPRTAGKGKRPAPERAEAQQENAAEPGPAPATAEPSPTEPPSTEGGKPGVWANPAWDDEVRQLISEVRATTTAQELAELVARAGKYRGPHRQDLGRVVTEQRAHLASTSTGG